MAGAHAAPSRWRKPLLIAAFFGAGVVGYQVAPHTPSIGMQQVSPQEADSQAQRLGNDVLGTCNINPSAMSTQVCGEAAEVAVTPVHDGKDGKNGLDGVNGVAGVNGVDGKDGRDGSDAKAQIIHHADGSTEYCPRSGGRDLYPVYDCVSATVIEKPKPDPSTSQN